MLLKIIPPVTVILIMDLLRYQYFPPPSSNSNRTVCLIFRNSTHTHKDLGTHSPYSKTSSTSILCGSDLVCETEGYVLQVVLFIPISNHINRKKNIKTGLRGEKIPYGFS